MKERQSNIELLRLVCMFMVIWIHFTIFGIFEQSSAFYASQVGFTSLLPKLILGLSWCAVDTFIIISGYFSIRPNARSFFNIYLVCAFYAGLLYLIHLYQIGSHLNRWVIYNTLMPFGLWETTTGWWFIPNYLMLYIISPILNRLTDNLSCTQFRKFLLTMAIPIFYFGWYRNMGWSEQGFNFVNFIFLYSIGRYLRMRRDAKLTQTHWTIFFALWLVSGAGIGLIDWLTSNYPVASPSFWYTRQYNSPLCVLSAVSLFMMFNSLNIKNNKIINWLAISALPIYLMHYNYYINGSLFDFIHSTYISRPMYMAYLVMLSVSLGLVIIIPILDKLRMLITTPINRALCASYYKIKLYIVKAYNNYLCRQ